MADSSQKTPLARTLNQFAERKVRGAMAIIGQSLPASIVSVVGSGIVTVKFELTNTPYTLPNVTVPMIGSEYVRLPIQPGCLGWVMTADAYLGGVSGLGGGTADLSQRANLSTLIWSPIGNKNWSPTDDPNAVVIYGPDGAIIRTTDKTSSLTIKSTGNVLKDGNGNTITTSATGISIVDKNGNEIATTASGVSIIDDNGNEIITGAGGLSLIDKFGNSVATSAGGVAITPASGEPIALDGPATISGLLIAEGAATIEGLLTAEADLAIEGNFTVNGGVAVARILAGSITTNFGGSLGAFDSQTETVTVAGAQVGDAVSLGQNAAIDGLIILTAYVSATNTVTLTVTNTFNGTVPVATVTYSVLVIG